MKNNSEFSLSDETRNKIEEKMQELLRLCQANKVPMFASVAVENNETTTQYNNIIYAPSSHNIKLKDDKIKKYMLVANGFDVVPQRNVITINPSDFIGD